MQKATKQPIPDIILELIENLSMINLPKFDWKLCLSSFQKNLAEIISLPFFSIGLKFCFRMGLCALCFFIFPVKSHATLPGPKPDLRIAERSRQAEFRIAAVWFLPDYQNSAKRVEASRRPTKNLKCQNYGYVSSCPSGKIGTAVHPYPGFTCYKNCKCPSSYQYTAANCSSPYYLTGAVCDGKYTQCQLNTAEACGDYMQRCPAGWEMSGERCRYDNTYGKCCNLCEGFDYAEIPQGYVETAHCDGCHGRRYQVGINPCEGYSECRYGASAGAKVCYSGTVKKYSQCQSCRFECELAACPVGNICRYESCSGKYCAEGCAVNYQPKESYWCGNDLSCWLQIGAGQECVQLPDCQALGYTKRYEDCWCKTFLRCPFDQNKVYCSD